MLDGIYLYEQSKNKAIVTVENHHATRIKTLVFNNGVPLDDWPVIQKHCYSLIYAYPKRVKDIQGEFKLNGITYLRHDDKVYIQVKMDQDQLIDGT